MPRPTDGVFVYKTAVFVIVLKAFTKHFVHLASFTPVRGCMAGCYVAPDLAAHTEAQILKTKKRVPKVADFSADGQRLCRLSCLSADGKSFFVCLNFV